MNTFVTAAELSAAFDALGISHEYDEDARTITARHQYQPRREYEVHVSANVILVHEQSVAGEGADLIDELPRGADLLTILGWVAGWLGVDLGDPTTRQIAGMMDDAPPAPSRCWWEYRERTHERQ